MSGVATAIAGSAIIGNYASNKASKRASETAQETSDAQLAYMRDAENRARADINRLFPQATDRRAQGFQQQMDFLSAALPTTLGAMQAGNVGAQNVLAGSMPQMQNAILGGPIDYSFAQPQTIDWQSQVQELMAGRPQVWQQPVEPTQPDVGVPDDPYAGVPDWVRNQIRGGRGFGLGGGGFNDGGRNFGFTDRPRREIP